MSDDSVMSRAEAVKRMLDMMRTAGDAQDVVALQVAVRSLVKRHADKMRSRAARAKGGEE